MRQEKYRPAWVPYPFNSGYFMCVRLKHSNAEDFRRRLLDRYGIGVIATNERDIRIAFSCVEKDELEELFDIMLRCAIEMSTRSKERG
jgi:aspartate/methionine/tyrosine aminotransferase